MERVNGVQQFIVAILTHGNTKINSRIGGTKMKKEYRDITELIKKRLLRDEHPGTRDLINELKGVKKRGYFTRTEFLRICKWKSPRARRFYESNSAHSIRNISMKLFATDYEKRKIELITSLSGVKIPTASAILMLTDPKNYGVIDIRVWQLLYLYRSVSTKPTGRNFSFKNWYNYLMKLRYYARKFNVEARKIERTLFEYHTQIQKGKLYN